MKSQDEQRPLEDLRAAGHETRSIWLWAFKRPREYLGAGEVLVAHLRAESA